MTSFNSVLLAPAAAVRLARRRFPARNGAADDLTIPPGWLNDLLERPLRMEAGWLGHGHGSAPRALAAGCDAAATEPMRAVVRFAVADGARPPWGPDGRR